LTGLSEPAAQHMVLLIGRYPRTACSRVGRQLLAAHRLVGGNVSHVDLQETSTRSTLDVPLALSVGWLRRTDHVTILPSDISLYNTLVEIRDSALKHGCSPNDVLHATTNALVAYDDLDDPYVLYLGPDTAGTLLEVLTAIDEQGEEVAFHAMPMRRKYRRLLP